MGSNPTSTALTCTNAGLGGSREAASCPASLIWSSQFSTVERYSNRVRRNCLARSQKSWTCLNGEAHAAGACALLFRAVQNRPRSAGCRQPKGRIKLGDREVPGERAPTRLWSPQPIDSLPYRAQIRCSGCEGTRSRQGCPRISFLWRDPLPIASAGLPVAVHEGGTHGCPPRRLTAHS